MFDVEKEITFSEEQAMLADTAISFFREKSPVEAVRKLIEDEKGYDLNVWQEMAELGWMGMLIPEIYGGAGLTAAELVSVMEPMGRHLMASPLVATTLAGQLILKAGSEEQKSKLLEGLASGQTIGSVAVFEPNGSWEPEHIHCTASKTGNDYCLNGIKNSVVDAGNADFVVASFSLEGSPALFLINKSQLEGSLTRELVVDETRRSYRMELNNLQVSGDALLTGGDSLAALQHTYHLAYVIHAAEMTGGANAALELTLEYLKTRKQFGKLIGGFQALKHIAVDVMIEIEHSRSHLYYAASVFDGAQGESAIAARMAKTHCGDSMNFATDRAIQFHGGMGFTYECHAGLYYRRAQWTKLHFGDVHHHRRHLAELLLG